MTFPLFSKTWKTPPAKRLTKNQKIRGPSNLVNQIVLQKMLTVFFSIHNPPFSALRGFHTFRNKSPWRGTRPLNLVLGGFHNLRLISFAALRESLLHCPRGLVCCMRRLRLVGSLQLQVSFAQKKASKRDCILQKRLMILWSLQIVGTPYPFKDQHDTDTSNNSGKRIICDVLRCVALCDSSVREHLLHIYVYIHM